MVAAAPRPFWRETSLTALSDSEWESLCDGCGKCCLHKLQEEYSGEVFYTRVACQLLDLDSGRCSDYANRCTVIPDCLDLRRLDPDQYHWLPDTCAYRLVAAGEDLPDWHPLVSGKSAWDASPEHTIRHRAIPEAEADPDNLEDEIVRWVNC